MKSSKLLLAALLGASLPFFTTGAVVASTVEVVNFGAPWCGPCRQMKPTFDRVAGEFGDSVKFRSVNVDSQKAFAGAHGVTALPTVIVFKDGKAVARHTGTMSAFRLRSLVRRNR